MQINNLKPTISFRDFYQKIQKETKQNLYAQAALGAATTIPVIVSQMMIQNARGLVGLQNRAPLLSRLWQNFNRLMHTPYHLLAAKSCRPIGSTLIFQEFFQSYLLNDTLSFLLKTISPKLGELPRSTEGKVIRVVLSAGLYTACHRTIDFLNDFSEEAIFARSINAFILGIFSGVLREATGNPYASMALNSLTAHLS